MNEYTDHVFVIWLPWSHLYVDYTIACQSPADWELRSCSLLSLHLNPTVCLNLCELLPVPSRGHFSQAGPQAAPLLQQHWALVVVTGRRGSCIRQRPPVSIR